MAQQDNPHQHNVDVGPQRLVMVDFVDLRDSRGDVSSGTMSQTQFWLCTWHLVPKVPGKNPGTPPVSPSLHTYLQFSVNPKATS